MEGKLSDMFRPNVNNFHILGVWPKSASKVYLAWTIVSMFLVIAMLVLEFAYFFSIFGDVLGMTECSFMLFTFVTNLIKCRVLYFRHGDFDDLLKFVDGPVFKPENQFEAKLIGDMKRYYLTMYHICVVLGMTCGVFWVSRPIFLQLEGELPINAYIPFQKEFPKMYHIMYGLQVFVAHWNCYFDLSFDVFASGILWILSTQLDILRNRIETRGPGTFVKCFEHYMMILRYSKMIESLYNAMVMVQFIGSVCVFCSTFMQLSMLNSFISMDTLSLMLYLTGLLTELFLFCWFGSEVEYKSNDIGTSIFYAPWIDATAVEKRNYIIFMQFSQKPLALKVLGLFPMSLNVFAVIVRTSYSYFTVLGNFKIE